MERIQVPAQRLRDQLAHVLTVLQAGGLHPDDAEALRQDANFLEKLLQTSGEYLSVPRGLAERYGWFDDSQGNSR